MPDIQNFKDFNLSLPLNEGLSIMGFTTPTPIQAQAIPHLLNGRDLLGQAQTGTGKTLAFSIPLIEKIKKEKIIQGLIVCPTRELCLQVTEEIKKLTVNNEEIKAVAIYGGQPIDIQLRAIKNHRPQIIVATPGRLFDHLDRKSINLSQIKMVILDEADEMLDMGFRENIEDIFKLAPKDCQRVFFSATMPEGILYLVKNYLKNPEIIKIAKTQKNALKINQKFYLLGPKQKTDILARVIELNNPKLSVVFCNTKAQVDELVENLNKLGFKAGALHGDLNQGQRDKVMNLFKSNLIQILVATDVAGRGIHVNDIELVVNYSVPLDPEDYVHRIGRTGRAGKEGTAISFAEHRDRNRLKQISRMAKIDIKIDNPPTYNEVKKARLRNYFSKVNEALQNIDLLTYKKIIKEQEINIEDLAAGMLALALPQRSFQN